MKKTHKTHKKYKKHKKNRKHTHKNIYKGGFWSFLNSQNNPNADGEVEAKFDFWRELAAKRPKRRLAARDF